MGDRICRHCGKSKVNRPRGLCWSCFQNPAIKALYPVDSKFAPKAEPTEAELEAIIAEQRQCLPSWWNKEKPEADE